MSSGQQIIVTTIVRLSDGLPLASGSEAAAQTDEKRRNKAQLNKILGSLKTAREPEACVPLGE
jgi:hypothetical protein